MKLVKYIASVITAISISTMAQAAEVRMAKANWDTGYFQAEVYKQALEKMGYKVTEPKAMKPSVFYVAAAAGDLDLWVNGWFGTHDTGDVYEDVVEDMVVDFSEIPTAWRQVKIPHAAVRILEQQLCSHSR